MSRGDRPSDRAGDDDLGEGALLLLPAGDDRRRELLDQRFAHGVLRAMHTADAAHREARVRAILESLPGAAVRPRASLLAAAVLFAALAAALWWAWRDAPPRADAMVQRAVADVSRPVDRRWAVEVRFCRRGRVVARREYELTIRSPRRFLLEGSTLLGPLRAGSDGDTVWAQPRLAWLRWSKPWPPGRRLGALLAEGQLDVDDVDLPALLDQLDRRAGSLSVQRLVATDPGAEPIVRIEARGVRRGHGVVRLRTVALEVGEASGAVQRIELVQPRGPGREKRVVFVARGAAALPDAAYRRPW
jgi:hypothetical protein